MLDFLHSLHSAEGLRHLIETGGLITIVAIVFAETGLLVGFFLPGDSLLVTAGIFAASDGHGGAPLFSLPLLLTLTAAAAIIGDQVGFALGRKAGTLAFSRGDSFFFRKKHFDAAHAFYEKHGARAIVFARFVPILRTFVPFAAGVAQMDYRKFVRWNIWGGLGWVFSIVLLGYFLGLTPLAQHLHHIIILVVFVSVLPIFIGLMRRWCARGNGASEAA